MSGRKWLCLNLQLTSLGARSTMPIVWSLIPLMVRDAPGTTSQFLHYHYLAVLTNVRTALGELRVIVTKRGRS